MAVAWLLFIAYACFEILLIGFGAAATTIEERGTMFLMAAITALPLCVMSAGLYFGIIRGNVIGLATCILIGSIALSLLIALITS